MALLLTMAMVVMMMAPTMMIMTMTMTAAPLDAALVPGVRAALAHLVEAALLDRYTC